MRTRKERSKLVDIITDIWENLTDPEKDDEFEEVNRQFKKYLRDIQIKTGTIKKDENLTKSSKYKIKEQNIRGERNSYTQGQGREERD